MDIGRATVERMGGHRLLEAWLLVSEGTILTAEGKGREAVAVLERSRVEKEKILGPDHHEVFIAVNNIGVGLQGAGRYEEARARYEEARLGFARVLGPDHPMVAMALNNEGESLSQLGRHGEARACFERAVAIWRKAETDPFLLSYGLTGLGAELVAEGRAGEAVAPLEEALRTRTAQQFDPEEVGKTRAALARAMALRPQRRP
jgi:tetratricopeptide (TPR) repeat protein